MFPIDKLNNLIKQHAIAVASTLVQTRIAQIANYDPDTYTAKVLIQPEGKLTNYLPIITHNVGNKWGFYSAPRAGDMCIIHFQENDLSTAFIGGFIYNNIDLAVNPGPPEGESWMIHKTGTFLKFHNDGTIEIKTLDTNGVKTNINISSNVVITGNLTVSGDVLDNSGTNSNTVKNMRTIYNTHTHPDPQGGNTNAPTQTM